MKKFHWGHGIFLFYVVFVAAVITALVASFAVDHSLVVDDYYAEDIAYQSTFDKKMNASRNDKLVINQQADIISIDFKTSNPVKGTIQFYRASNKSQDFLLEFTESVIQIPTKELARGKWKVKIDWVEGNEAYYKVEELYL